MGGGRHLDSADSAVISRGPRVARALQSTGGMSNQTRTRKHRRGIQHRLRPKPRRRRERHTYLAAAIVDSRRAPRRVDQELWNGFVYMVGVHARNPAIVIHDLSFDGSSYWVIFSSDPASCEAFLEGVARDFGGFLRAYTGDDELTIHPELPISLDRLGSSTTAAGPAGPC